jgi:AraC family transcriptional regulator
MKNMERIQNAIDYIEDHLKDELPIERIAREAHFSMWHFQRVFGTVVGLGVKEYVRKRRLTLAMQELAGTDRPIIDIALDYQFESQESFTRTFKAHFGLTPGDCRKRGIGSIPMHHKPKITLDYLEHLQEGIDMQPEFIELPQKKVVGLGAKFISILSPDKNNMDVIPALWGTFMSQYAAIPHKAGGTCFGLVESVPDEQAKSHNDELFYIASAEVTDFNAIPNGMLQRTIPGGRYAVFTHKGTLVRLGHTMNYIYGSWLTKSDVELRDAPHLELYDERFIPNSDKSEFDILLPVK